MTSRGSLGDARFDAVVLRMVHRHPGVTRADAARLLGVGTGAATELVTKLSRAALLAQAPAAPSGARGRPTTVLLPHPDGPLVLALAITHEAWRLDVAALGGTALASLSERHGGAPWAEVRAAVTVAIKDLLSWYGDGLRAIGVSVPGPVSRSLRLDAFNSDCHGIDLNDLWPEAGLLVAGNDATAEHRHRGIAGLVNALDPDLVTLGGLGVDLLAAVPEVIDAAYRDGLMLIHRAAPPPVRPAALPDDEGPIAGAAEEAWSALLPRLT